MSKWEMVKLSEICEVQAGGTPSRSEKEYWTNGTIPWVKIGDIKSKYISNTSENITKLGLENSSAKLLKKGTLLYTIFATLGEVAILDIDACTNQAIVGIILKDNRVYDDFLYVFLTSIKKKIIEVGRGVAQNNINLSILKNIEIPLPPLDEQIRIANELDKITKLIEKRKTQIEKLDLLVKAKFVEMFGDPVTNPMGWETNELSSIGNCKNGMNFSNTDTGVEIKCIGVGDFKDLSVIKNTNILTTISLNNLPADDYYLKNGDIIFVRSNGNKELVGRCILVFPEDIPTTFSGFCIRLRITNKAIKPEYMVRLLKTNSMRKKMSGRGANIQNLNQQILYSLVIPIPPLDLQTQFAEYVQKAEQIKSKMEMALKQLQILYKSRMQEHFE